MGLAAAAAGKRKVAAASYNEDSDGEVSDGDEYVPPPAKAMKTPTAATAAATKTKSVTAPEPSTAKAPTAKEMAAAAKAANAATKAVIAKLGVLDRSQLADVVKRLLENGSVPASAVDALLPAPDMSLYVKEGARLCNAICRALPNSRWGSCTDHYGYKRCASANNAAKKYIVDHAKVFKTAKQWQAAREYCIAMLPVARNMVDFDCVDDRKAKNATIETLQKLKIEAESKLGLQVQPSGGGASSSASAPPAALSVD